MMMIPFLTATPLFVTYQTILRKGLAGVVAALEGRGVVGIRPGIRIRDNTLTRRVRVQTKNGGNGRAG